MKRSHSPRILLPLLLVILLGACAGWDPQQREHAAEQSRETIARFRQHDPSIERFFANAYGYAIFPTVGKGAATLGGAYGRGELLERGVAIGQAELVQLTVGLQLGGQAYSEVIFFQDRASLERFKRGELEFSAQASAVAAVYGAAANAAYEEGVAVFTLTKGGLMYEASIGGQSFRFSPY